MRLEQELIAVAVTEILDDALSAVYTFYHPDFKWRSPGKFAILFQILQAGVLGQKWLYLGYWIKNSEKMRYKSEFQPQQHFYANAWHDFQPCNPCK
jgi:arginine-tRNA-protein transferase